MMDIYSKTSVVKVLAKNPVQLRCLLEHKKVLWAWGDHGPSDFKRVWMNPGRLESVAACKILAVTCLYQRLWTIKYMKRLGNIYSASLACSPHELKSVLIATYWFHYNEEYLPGHCEVIVVHRLPETWAMPNGLSVALTPCWCSEDGYGSRSGITTVSNGNALMILCTNMGPWRLLSEIQY